MKCIVVDDDPVSVKLLVKCLEKLPFINIVSTFDNAIDASGFLIDNKIDLVLLDIEMPEMNGIEMMKNLTKIPQVVFVTAKKEYAVEAFELNATDYLVKPIQMERVVKAVEKAKSIMDQSAPIQFEDTMWFLKSGTSIVNINSENILWIEALGDYITINMSDGKKHVTHSTMKGIEEKLAEQHFIRIHRSYIIRKDKITSIEDNLVYINDLSFPISRSYREEFKSKLNLL